MDQQVYQETEDQNTLDFSLVLDRIKSKKLLIGFVIILVTFLGLFKMYTQTPIWEAKTTLIFPAKASNLSGAAGAMGAALGLGSSGKDTINMFSEILKSDNIITHVAQKFHSKKEKVKKSVSIKEKAISSTIELTFKNSTRENVRLMSQEYIAQLKRIIMELDIPSSERELDILKKELAVKTSELQNAEDQMQNFLEQARTAPTGLAHAAGQGSSSEGWSSRYQKLQLQYDQINSEINKSLAQIESITKESQDIPTHVESIQDWRNKLVKLQYSLKVKEISLGPGSPEVIKLQEQIEITKSYLKSEVEKYYKSAKTGTAGKISELMVRRAGIEGELQSLNKLAALAPKEEKSYQRMIREVLILSESVQQLRSKYEMLKLHITRDPNNWHILDNAVISDNPVNKDFIQRGFLCVIFGAVIGILIALIQTRNFNAYKTHHIRNTI